MPWRTPASASYSRTKRRPSPQDLKVGLYSFFTRGVRFFVRLELLKPSLLATPVDDYD